MRPGARALGVALDRLMLWTVVRATGTGRAGLAVKGSAKEGEVVLGRVTGSTTARGPFLGPVVASDWLRLFAFYHRLPTGDLEGTVISGNAKSVWDDRGPMLPVGLDPFEHVVLLGAKGEIAMLYAHSRRHFGRVEGARARAASSTATR